MLRPVFAESSEPRPSAATADTAADLPPPSQCETWSVGDGKGRGSHHRADARERAASQPSTEVDGRAPSRHGHDGDTSVAEIPRSRR